MSRRVALLGLLAFAAAACGKSYAPTPTSFRLPSAAEGTEVLGAIVSARAFDDAGEARDAFGGFDMRKAGLLPIQLVFQNQGTRFLEVNAAQTFVEDRDENLWPLLEEKLAYDRAAASANTNRAFKEGAHKGFLGAAAGAVIGAAVGTVTSANVGTAAARGAAVGGAAVGTAAGAKAYGSGEARREVIHDLETKSLERKPIQPGSIAHGFLFFPGEIEDAKVLRLQVRDTKSGQVDAVELAL